MFLHYRCLGIILFIFFIGAIESPAQCNSGELGWLEIGAIFNSSNCNGCHGSVNGVSNFNLTTYNDFLLGGVKCGSSITAGTTLVDIITMDNYEGCRVSLVGQSMNSRVMGAMDSLEILKVQRWVNAGFPESCENFCITDEFIFTTLNSANYHFNVDETLTANNSILNGSTINYEAGNIINLNTGFSVDVSSDFYAFIGKCDF